MDLNREILSLTSGLDMKPFSIIRTETQRHRASATEYIKIRRILREWYAHFRDVPDDTNYDLIRRLILLVGGKILNKYIDAGKRSMFIPRDNLHMLYKEYGSELPEIIIDKIKRRVIDFPYKKYMISSGELEDCISYIKSFTGSEISDRDYELREVTFSEGFRDIWENPLLLKPDNRYATFVHTDMEYQKIDYITDYFTESERMKARRVDSSVEKSPYEIWTEGLPIVTEILVDSITDVLGGKSDVLTPKILRDVYL